jgi:hypothetical protein
MIKYLILLLVSLLIILLNSCSSADRSESFDYDKETPQWLKIRIDSISTSTGHYYDLTKVYRYNWKDTYIYHFSIPLSSCVYCELYDQNGRKISAAVESSLKNILHNRKNEVLIWDNKK